MGGGLGGGGEEGRGGVEGETGEGRGGERGGRGALSRKAIISGMYIIT